MDDIDRPKRYSEVWDYFTKKADFIANCNICKNDYSYKSSVSNLSKHRQRKHGHRIDEDITDCSDNEINTPSNEIKNSTKKESSSHSTWQYFEILDSDQFVARCKVCERDISYDSVSELTKHARKHNNLVSDDEEWLEKEKTSGKKKPKRANTSAVWRFMEVIDEEAKNVVCLLCRRQLSYVAGTSNLRKHIHRVHPHISIEGDIVDNDKKVIISSDGQLYEIATSDGEKDPIQTDEVYLEDTNDSIEYLHNEPPPKRIKNNETKSLKRKLVSQEPFQNTNTRTDTSNKIKYGNTPKNDCLRIFGEYVISLLEKLPEEVSDQLQSDFIKQIFTAKHALKQYSVTLHDKPITVTINNDRNMPEVTIHDNSDVIVTETTEKSINEQNGN